jgi:hypothetical protein
MIDETVVGETTPLPRPRLHAKLMHGWSRAIDRLGKGAFCDAIECTGPGVDKQLAGSMPTLEVIDRALCVAPDVLDDWLRAKGLRLVAENAVCDSDDLQLVLARALVMLNEAEHPDSPGGRTITHQEYLTGEAMMRELHAATGSWLQKCTNIRRPTVVAS